MTCKGIGELKEQIRIKSNLLVSFYTLHERHLQLADGAIGLREEDRDDKTRAKKKRMKKNYRGDGISV